MRGSIRQFSMLKMKKTLIEMLNGLWNKNKARGIFLEARLHLPTPASADGRGSRVSTPSTSCCHILLRRFRQDYLLHPEEKGECEMHVLGWSREPTPTKASLTNHLRKTSRISVPLLQTENLFVLRRCHSGSPKVASWEYPVVHEKDRGGTRPARLWQLPPLPISSLG